MKTLMQNLVVALVLLGGVCKSFAPFVAGFLQVNILPGDAAIAGAQWSVDGPLPVRDSGTYTVAAVGAHTVYFTDITGWITPASVDVTISQGQTNVINGTYVLASGVPLLAVRLTPTNTVVVSWPSPSTNWKLQQNTNLATTNWVAPPETVTDDGTNKFIIVRPPSGNMLFRLQQ
jgi:hypothetical protein